MARESLFCIRWIRNNMRKVIMVVLVLITSCHVSEKLKKGPVISHTTTISKAIRNDLFVPLNTVAVWASLSKKLFLMLMQIREQFACHGTKEHGYWGFTGYFRDNNG